MKRLLVLAFAVSLALPSAAFAAFEGASTPMAGGFQGPTTRVDITTVEKAKKSWDDARVELTGNIVQRVAGSDDKYIFRDGTGEIVIDLDYEIFAGRTVTPETKVRLFGKVDKDFMEETQVDVKVMEILK